MLRQPIRCLAPLCYIHLDISLKLLMIGYLHNMAMIFIDDNPNFCEWTKHSQMKVIQGLSLCHTWCLMKRVHKVIEYTQTRIKK